MNNLRALLTGTELLWTWQPLHHNCATLANDWSRPPIETPVTKIANDPTHAELIIVTNSTPGRLWILSLGPLENLTVIDARISDEIHEKIS